MLNMVPFFFIVNYSLKSHNSKYDIINKKKNTMKFEAKYLSEKEEAMFIYFLYYLNQTDKSKMDRNIITKLHILDTNETDIETDK